MVASRWGRLLALITTEAILAEVAWLGLWLSPLLLLLTSTKSRHLLIWRSHTRTAEIGLVLLPERLTSGAWSCRHISLPVP